MHAGEWKMDDIGLDGSWLAHRNSAVGYYTATDVTRGKIIKGNYNGTSKGMQGEGCRRLLNRLEREQLLSKVKTITTDSDSSVVKILAEDERLSHIKVTMPFLFTCTHTIKAFVKQLKTVLGKGKDWAGKADKMGCWLMLSRNAIIVCMLSCVSGGGQASA